MAQSYFKCPHCFSDSYLNPNIKIYVSPCYHKICENCFFRIFQSGEANCPECGNFLRKSNFIFQTMENIEIERECQIRKSLKNIYRLEYEDFESSEKYDLYLEEFENKIFQLMEIKNEKLLKDQLLKIRNDVILNDGGKRRKRVEMPKKEEKIEIFEESVVDFLIDDIPKYYRCEGLGLPYYIIGLKCIHHLK